MRLTNRYCILCGKESILHGEEIESPDPLALKGLLIAKLADCTHRNRFQFATADFYVAAAQYGFELQGNHILPRKNVIIDPKWKKASHPRQNHSTFMAFNKMK